VSRKPLQINVNEVTKMSIAAIRDVILVTEWMSEELGVDCTLSSESWQLYSTVIVTT
jgi:hypothetical protein